jgi:regulatory protein
MRRASAASATGDTLVSDANVDRAVAEARERGVRLLGQREHSARQLVAKLQRKGFAADVARCAVEQLGAQDLQSDRRFAEALTHRRIESGYGPMFIRSELRECGIDDELIDEMLTRSGEFWLAVAHRAHARKFGERPAPWDTRARFLARRGFPSDLIYRTLGRGHDRGPVRGSDLGNDRGADPGKDRGDD